MNRTKYARLMHTLYRVALSLVLSMLMLVPVENIGRLPAFLPLVVWVLLEGAEKALFSELRFTTSKLE